MIIDTNILSALFSRDAKRRAQASEFLSSLPKIKTSVIVAYEIEYGLIRLNSKTTLRGFHALLEENIELIEVTSNIALMAAKKRAEQESKGSIFHTEDLIIGATAKSLDVPIATENKKDFAIWDIEMVSPFH